MPLSSFSYINIMDIPSLRILQCLGFRAVSTSSVNRWGQEIVPGMPLSVTVNLQSTSYLVRRDNWRSRHRKWQLS